MMATSQTNNSHKDRAMEFKLKDDLVVVDEKKTSVFEAQQEQQKELTQEQIIAMNKRRMEAFSDCA